VAIGNIHIICGAGMPCGFRVDAGYFLRKTRFSPGICANCNGPLRYVRAYTLVEVPGLEMVLQQTDTGPPVGSIVETTPA
jgi:hypothetical protein